MRAASFRKLAAAALFALSAFVLASPSATRMYRASALLSALAVGQHDAEQYGVLPIVTELDLSVPGRNGAIRARIYRRPDQRRARGLVLAHGVHYRGIDEERLVPFARELARSGLVVLTPELDDLADYRITTAGAGVISDSVRYLSTRKDLLVEAKVGVIGLSFAGGLALVAASEPELDGKLLFVTSVGGHHDLARVLRFFIRNEVETPEGTRREPAHDYGLLVLIYGHLEHFVPEADRAVVGQALRAWLHEEKSEAFARVALRTTREGERVYELAMTQKLQVFGPELEAIVAGHASELTALSPKGRLGRIRAPVYLLHGEGDNVIPPSETRWAALELETHEHVALVSPLLRHVDVDRRARLFDQIALVRFMSHML